MAGHRQSLSRIRHAVPQAGLLGAASVAIDGSKLKAVNAYDKTFTKAKMKRRLKPIEERIARDLSQLEAVACTRGVPRLYHQPCCLG